MPLSTIFPALNLSLGLLALISTWFVVRKIRGTTNSLSWSLIMVAAFIFSIKYLLILLNELGLLQLMIDVEVSDLLVAVLLIIAALKLNHELAKLIKRQE